VLKLVETFGRLGLVGRGLGAPPKNPTPLSAFGLDFRPFSLAPVKNPGHAPDSDTYVFLV